MQPPQPTQQQSPRPPAHPQPQLQLQEEQRRYERMLSLQRLPSQPELQQQWSGEPHTPSRKRKYQLASVQQQLQQLDAVGQPRAASHCDTARPQQGSGEGGEYDLSFSKASSPRSSPPPPQPLPLTSMSNFASFPAFSSGSSRQYEYDSGFQLQPASLSSASSSCSSSSSSSSQAQSLPALTPPSPRSSASTTSYGSRSTSSSSRSLQSPRTPLNSEPQQPLSQAGLPSRSHSMSSSGSAASPAAAPPLQTSAVSSLTPPQPPQRRVDSPDEHHLVVQAGERLVERYEVVRVLGHGTFSQVVQCRDLMAEQLALSEDASASASSSSSSSPPAAYRRRNVMVAIKIVRAVDRYRFAAEREARLLQHLNAKKQALSASSPLHHGAEGCVPFLGSFPLEQHICLVMPVLGLSLYDFLRLNRFQPLFPAHIRHIAHQLLLTAHWLHDECGIVHTQIQPETVLLVNSEYQTVQLQELTVNVPLSTNVRLTDFGTAVQAGSVERPALVCSRSYRAVEVVLGIGWGSGVDVWAIGCLLMELYTGSRLFHIGSGSDEDHLKQMEAALGPIPLSLLTQPRVYTAGGDADSTPPSPHWSLRGGGAATVAGRLRDRVVASDLSFCGLVERMLTFDPAHRITARQALQHAYFHET